MNIKNATALITGANRGLGRAFAQRLLDRGASKVYATARRPESIDLVSGSFDALQQELDTNLLGQLRMIRSFAPVLRTNGGGAIVNVLSAMSWFPVNGSNSYHLTKGAAWAMTNGVRMELADHGTLVTAVHLGLADTDMTSGWDVPKLMPVQLVDAALDGVEGGAAEVLADDWSRGVKERLSLPPEEFNAAMDRAFATLTTS